jgi:UDP-glucose 4-epimerase
MSVLVTGGAGYIGSHTCVALLEAGEDVIVIDNLYNAKASALDAVRQITGKDLTFYENDVRDKAALRRIFNHHDIDAVLHFAGYKAAPESVAKPLMYFENNMNCTFSLLEVMNEFGVKNFVFSSSATVYGIPEKVPVTEDFPLSAINPYGETKLITENLCRDICRVNKDFSAVLLRYFNPLGAHESGLIGDDPNGIPNNLMPFLLKVVKGVYPVLSVYGNDYPTPDGTCIRDYIHVLDLASGHVAALNYARENTGAEAFNLGTGKGYSVLEIVDAFEKSTGITVPYVIADRRPGDGAECYSDPTKAKTVLGWSAERSLDQMCRDAWRYAKQ